MQAPFRFSFGWSDGDWLLKDAHNQQQESEEAEKNLTGTVKEMDRKEMFCSQVSQPATSLHCQHFTQCDGKNNSDVIK